LKRLDLSFNRFKNGPKIAALIEKLPRLKCFKACGNQMLSHFSLRHPKLAFLALDTNKLQSVAVEAKNLKHLQIRNNMVEIIEITTP